MFGFLKNLFAKKAVPIIVVKGVKDVKHFMFIQPPKDFVIGVKAGTLDSANKRKLLNNESFEFYGSSSDFVILPKTDIKDI